ncbi:hypothetical protein FACS1894181_02850 [Bacteroidia bacterium]|nr:hypothetical protein FACS1894181_02850 [Bacteroidia bacterium]
MAGKKSTLTPLWDRKTVRQFFEKAGQMAGIAIEELLFRTGEEFVKVARQKGTYQDWTGNLRSSIGYIVALDGNILGKNFQLSEKNGTDKQTGKREAEQMSSDLALLYNKGYVLVCVSGMKYAAYVEAMDNKDVISLAATEAEAFVRKHSRLLFKRLQM